MLNGLQIIPFEIELRDTLDAALYHFERFATCAADALTAQDATVIVFKAAAKGADADKHGALREQRNAQTLVFDYLDAFLGAFTRVSLLIFPIAMTAFAKERATTMQTCLQLDESSLLADRELRGSWTHHDERLDFAVQNKLGATGQTFTRSTDKPAEKQRTFLRVIELDTLVIRFRTRKGEFRATELKLLHKALVELDKQRVGAFSRLPVPDDA